MREFSFLRDQRNGFRPRESFSGARAWNGLIEAYKQSASTILFDYAGPQLDAEIRG